MKELLKLIDVKTIVTFACVGVFAYLSTTGKIPVEQFMTVLIMIITFFFAKKPSDSEVK